MIGMRCAWHITKNPAIKILYLSSISNLAEKQLGLIKNVLTSPIYRMYWPEMVREEEGKREKWTSSEISVDHPLRHVEAIRDPTVFTAGLTTSITGLHCDIAVLDDVVVKENAYTDEGREKVRQQYSLLASVEGSEAREWVVGTRYHPNDLYSDLLGMKIQQFDENEEEIESLDLFEKIEYQVENRGDGYGEFLWPRQQRSDGKFFGFNASILARKRAQYLDQTQFRAQYYNDPNDYETAAITRDMFQYYNKSYLSCNDGRWYYKNARLNVFAAVDFAFSVNRRSDYTAIVVVGVDGNRNYYVLDIDRFKTGQISDYFSHILHLVQKWDIRKIRAECTAAQQTIVNELRNSYIRPHGIALAIDDYKPTRNEGTKEERIYATLQPVYANRQVWHYQGGNCQTLEDELVLAHPPHDDVKDALASAVDIAQVPSMSRVSRTQPFTQISQLVHSKFGGIA